jgi:GT2 family glycosyltransferase
MEVGRLLASLAKSRQPLRAVVVVDNAGDFTPSVEMEVQCLKPGRNLGCGGGLALGEKDALARYGESLTHVWILDDDAIVEPDTLDLLLAAMAAGQADAAHPLTVDANGQLGWFPGLLDGEKFDALKQARTPEEFIASHGAEPVPFSWSQGIALLVTRRVISELGVHRDDYWVRGEDLEFSLRITYRPRGLYVVCARVHHLPPRATPSSNEYLKHQAMLQNIAYTSFHLAHGRRILRTIPGNWFRFFRTWGWKPGVFGDSLRAFLRGAVFARPAGHEFI